MAISAEIRTKSDIEARLASIQEPTDQELEDPELEELAVRAKMGTFIDQGDGVNLISQYFRDINRYPLLNAQQEVELSKRIEQGDLQAAHRMTECNLRLVTSTVLRYKKTGLPLLDQFQEGNIGLMRAVQKFDWRRGWKFSTYATWWIRQGFTRGIIEQGRVIKLPVHIVEAASKIIQARTTLIQQHNREVSHAEVAAYLGVEEQKVAEVERAIRVSVSLDQQLAMEPDHPEGLTLADTLSDPNFGDVPNEVGQRLLALQTARVMGDCLTERERLVIKLHYGLDGTPVHPLEVIGKHLGLTRERVRQIEAQALEKLRSFPQTGSLRMYLNE